MKNKETSNLGKVFSFTLSQHFKSRATIISLAIFALLALASMPVMALIFSAGPRTVSPVETVRLINSTPYAVTADDIASADPGFMGLREEPGGNTAEAVVSLSLSEDGVLQVDADRGSDRDVSDSVLESLAQAAASAARNAMLRSTGADYDKWYFDTKELDDYLAPAEESNMSFQTTYMYSILVMALTIMSSSYIIRSVVEEKSSKLVELLTVSVKPMELLLGKVAAMACVVFSFILGFAALAGISYAVTSAFLDMSFIGEYMRSSGLGVIAGAGAAQAAVVLVSLLLAYALFAMAGGLAGACCSTQEETGSAVLSVMLASMLGYFGSIILSALGIKAVTVAASLLPVLSAFMAPTAYISGDIGIGLVLLSWVIQLAVLALLSKFTAGVYSTLIMRSGSRIKLRQLASLAGKGAAQ